MERRRKRSRRWLLGAALAAVALGAVALVAGGPIKRRLTAALDEGPLRARRAERFERAPFDHLAASQAGYGPSMRKRFTSPRPFPSFRVLDERTGAVALEGGAPVREVQTDLLGPLRTVWIGDFSAVRAPGRYRLVLGDGLASHPFDVGPEVFDRPLRAVQRWFYYQRAFTAVEAAHAEGPWVHPSDEDKAPTGVRRGWHDAGDFSVYSTALNSALFWLLEARDDFSPAADDTNLPESGNGVPDLLDEARWGLEWLLSVQAETGGFLNTTCQEGYGPYGTNTPENVPLYRNGEVGTIATARAVGSLARAAATYRRFDAAFADRCLRAAEGGWRYLRLHWGENTDGPTCPAERSDGNAEVGRGARAYAAAGLLLATGERQYEGAYAESAAELQYDPGFMQLDLPAALLYLRAPSADPSRKAALRARLRALAEVAVAEGDKHPFGWATRYHWGSIGAGFWRSAYGVKACLEDPARGAACEQALDNLHYVLGRNSLQFCYVSGLPGVTAGRRHGFHHWLATLAAEPHDFPGMVAGGPCTAPEAADASYPRGRPIPAWGYFGDPAFPRDETTPVDGRYTDNDSWSTNEVSVEWQALTLYNLYFAQWVARGGRERAAGQ